MTKLFGNRADWYYIFNVTVIIEVVTCFFRFVLKVESARGTAFLAPYTLGLRIHHSYIGVLMIVLSYYFQLTNIWKKRFLRIGWCLVFSDIIHHCVLRIVTGSFHFDLVYMILK